MFSDQTDPYLYDVDSVMDPTRSLQDTNDATLDNFFTRPIKIAEEEWATSTALAFDLNPWKLYFENKRVANRLANFNLLKANLKIKVVINGNGFQYGRAIVSYLPFDQFDTLSTNAALVREDLVQASQQPHLFLDPTTSQGGEMKLPFFNYYNYISIPESQWDQLGQLYVRSLNTLKHANGATDVVTVSIFAWAEDVSMSVLTSVESDTLTPQSGTETDEANAKGIISGPATTIAKVAGALSGIPQIAPFALATQTAANTTAAIAKSFGFCKPTITKAPEPYRPTPGGTLALTNIPDNVVKLTIDDKQELSIDPRLAGLGSSDSLSIKEIAKRESYLTTFSWPIGTAPETLLWNGRIDPVTWAENPGTPTSFHFPACAMAAMPFKFWTGSMKFRFQIVCSSFHKGRIKVVYDPNFLASNEYNINYLNVIDIADEQDFTIEVANGQDRTLLSHHLPGFDSVTQMYSTTAYTSKEVGNGLLGVYVVNELTTPNSTTDNDIEINVFVSMGDDFEVFVPDDHFQRFVFKPQVILDAQSGVELVPESQNTGEPSAPQQEQSMDLGPTKSDLGQINHVYTGEAIASFRTLLKRYNLWRSMGNSANTESIMSGRLAMFPFLRGNVAGAVDVASSGPYNYCNTILLHWVTYAFSGWRGSTRFKLLPRGPFVAAERPTIYVQRHPLGEIEYQQFVDTPPSYLTQSEVAHSAVLSSGGIPDRDKPFTGAKGQTYTTGIINPTLEFELPFYSPFRFAPGKTESYTGVGLWAEGFDYRMWYQGQTSTAYDIHTSVGEDFQVYFFTGLPRMYFENGPPNPA